MINYSKIEKLIMSRETELQIAYDIAIEKRDELNHIIETATIELQSVNEQINRCLQRAQDLGMRHILEHQTKL